MCFMLDYVRISEQTGLTMVSEWQHAGLKSFMVHSCHCNEDFVRTNGRRDQDLCQ